MWLFNREKREMGGQARVKRRRWPKVAVTPNLINTTSKLRGNKTLTIQIYTIQYDSNKVIARKTSSIIHADTMTHVIYLFF